MVERAEAVLKGLEEARERNDGGRTTNDGGTGRQVDKESSRQGDKEKETGLSSVAREDPSLYTTRAEMLRAIFQEIADADIANMTPVQALNLLNEMQSKLKESDSEKVE